MVLTNPPFGRKSSMTFVSEEGEVAREDLVVVRDDFWASTSNKQLNFVQHVRTLLSIEGRAAVVVPDNVLFEGGAGETVRRKLLARVRRAHAAPASDRCLLRAGREGERPLLRPEARVGDSVDARALGLRPAHEPALHAQAEPACGASTFRTSSRRSGRVSGTCARSRSGSSGSHTSELLQRDKVSLDLTWLRDESLEDMENLPPPDVIAQEIVEDLEAALAEFAAVAESLGATRDDAT